jgi:hypothetical protein
VQGAAGFEHAPYLAQCSPLLVRPEVVEYEGGKHPVERSVRVRELLYETAVQPHGEPRPFGFPLGTGECLRIGIQADYLGARVEAFDEDRQVPGTAADLEDPLARADARLLDQPPMVRPEAH